MVQGENQSLQEGTAHLGELDEPLSEITFPESEALMWLWLRRLLRVPTIIITKLWICREKCTLNSILNAHRLSLLLKEAWDNLGHQGVENNPPGRGELPGEGRLLGMLWTHWTQLPQLLNATMKWSSKNADFPKFLEKRLNWGEKKKHVFLKESIPAFTSNKTKWLAFERLKASQKKRLVFLYLYQAIQ